MLNKNVIAETLKKLPEEFHLEELIDKLILLDKIERAENQSANNEVLSEAELEKEMEKWFR